MVIGTGSTLTNCLFVSNEGQGRGGAVFITGNPTLTNCTFRGNLASGLGGAANGFGSGGALYIAGGSPIITNCSFSNNNAAARRFATGGAIYNTGTPTFINCSFANNQTSGTGGAIYNIGTPTFINCIIWGNTPNNIINEANGNAVLTYTNTQDPIPGTGNISVDPLFIDAVGDNLRLRACSPAIDRGNNGSNANPTDLVGNPRQVRTIDMGAYEFQGTPSSLVSITQQPNSFYSIPEGGTLTASVSVTGSITGYQWYKVGPTGTPVALPSATTATLTLSNLTTADNGSYYVIITGACNSITSSSFTLLVNTGMYTIRTGSWDDATIWSLNRVPLSSDPIRLKHPVFIPASYVAHARLVSYDPGQRLQFGSASRLQLGH
jgi:hypothetical protein